MIERVGQLFLLYFQTLDKLSGWGQGQADIQNNAQLAAGMNQEPVCHCSYPSLRPGLRPTRRKKVEVSVRDHTKVRAGRRGRPPGPRAMAIGVLIVVISALAVGCDSTAAISTEAAPPQPETSETAEPEQPETSGPVESAPSSPSTPISTHLILSKAPRLNEQADLTFTVTSIVEAPGTTAAISLPEGAVLVEGDLEWSGDLVPEQPQTLQATIMFVREGNWIIEAKALCPLDNGDVWGDAAYIYLYVSEEEGHAGFSDEPSIPRDALGEEVPSPPPVEPSE
jgi:hypothetical protein